MVPLAVHLPGKVSQVCSHVNSLYDLVTSIGVLPGEGRTGLGLRCAATKARRKRGDREPIAQRMPENARDGSTSEPKHGALQRSELQA